MCYQRSCRLYLQSIRDQQQREQQQQQKKPYELYALYDWEKSSGTLWNFVTGVIERNNYKRNTKQKRHDSKTAFLTEP